MNAREGQLESVYAAFRDYSPTELEHLTGVKRHPAQIRHLRKMGIRPFVNAKGLNK